MTKSGDKVTYCIKKRKKDELQLKVSAYFIFFIDSTGDLHWDNNLQHKKNISASADESQCGSLSLWGLGKD